MARPEDLTQLQRTVLLQLASMPPGRWADSNDSRTVRSLRRRGLVESNARGQIRLAHNSHRVYADVPRTTEAKP